MYKVQSISPGLRIFGHTPFDRRGATYQERVLFEGLRLVRVSARAMADGGKYNSQKTVSYVSYFRQYRLVDRRFDNSRFLKNGLLGLRC